MPLPGVGQHGKPLCTAPGCNKIYRGEDEIREKLKFHMFPNNEDLVKRWLDRLGLEGFQPRTCNRVCGRHFDADAYRPTKSGKLLKTDALPIPVQEELKPSRICLVPGCSARSDRPGRYALFPFPDPVISSDDHESMDLFLGWCQFCQWEADDALPRTAAICANHFKPQDIVNAGDSVILKPGSLPLHFGPNVFTSIRSSSGITAPPANVFTLDSSTTNSIRTTELARTPGQKSKAFGAPGTPALDQKAFNRWKVGGCQFQCALCSALVSHTLELAQHLRAIHGLDLAAYIQAHGHCRVQTAYMDCALCAESVMHDLGSVRRHLLVVHAGLSLEKYYEKYVMPYLTAEDAEEEQVIVEEDDEHSSSKISKIHISSSLADLIT